MLFTTLTLPEDVHAVSGRTDPRRPHGARTDARPPAPRREPRPVR